MSREVDERIVEMQFDNEQFEEGIAESMESLEDFDDQLSSFEKARFTFRNLISALSDLGGSVYFVKNVGSAFKGLLNDITSFEVFGVSVKGIANGIEATFSHMYNNVKSYVDKLVNSFTLESAAQGWQKYGQKTSSVQTIINATGKTIDEVNSYLDKLMWYSDETSYGFTDMTQSLGQLTSAGGDIDKLIPMIEGIANATAYAGKGAAEFSRVIYNLNQSYGAGFLQYMDWKSIDLAGVSSKALKQAFIDAGKAVGTLTQEGKAANGELVEIGNFGQTLNQRWATTEVMEKAFSQFSELTDAVYEGVQSGKYDMASEGIADLADKYNELASTSFKAAQEAKTYNEAIDATVDAVSSGWMKTFELIAGNYDQAKVLWTGLANDLWDIFAGGGENRNELIGTWSSMMVQLSTGAISTSGYFKEMGKGFETLSGRELLIESLSNIFGVLRDTVLAVRDAFWDFLPDTKLLAKDILEATVKFHSFSETVKDLGEHFTYYLKPSMNTIFESAKPVLESVGKLLKSIFGTVSVGAPDILKVVQKATKFVTSLLDRMVLSEETISKLTRIFVGFKSAIKIVAKVIEALLKPFGSILDISETAGGGILELIARLADFITNLYESGKAAKVIENTGNKLKDIFSFLAGIVKKVGDAFSFLFGKAKNATEGIKWDSMTNPLDIIKAVIDRIVEKAKTIGGAISGIASAIGTMFQAIMDSKVGDYISNIYEKIKELFSSGEGNGSGGESPAVAFLNALVTLVEKLTEKLKDINFNSIIDFVNKILGSGILIAILGIVNKISKFGKDIDIVGRISDIGKSIDEFFKSLTKTLKDFASKKLQIEMLKTLATSLLMLAASLLIISLIDSDKLLTSWFVIASLIGGLIFAFNQLQGVEIDKSVTGTILALAAAIFILSISILMLSFGDVGSIITGTLAIIFVLAAVVAAIIVLSKNAEEGAKGIGSIIAVALSVLILAAAIKLLANENWKSLLAAGSAVVILLAGVVGAIWALSKIKFDPASIAAAAGSMMLIGVAILIMSAALKVMSTIDAGTLWSSVGAVVVLIGVMIALFAALTGLQVDETQMLAAAGSIIIISAALVVMASALKILSTIDSGDIWSYVGALSALMAVAVAAMMIAGDSIAGAAGMLVMSIAIIAMAAAFKILESVDMSKLVGPLIALGAALVVLSLIALALMSTGAGEALALIGAVMILLSISVGILAVSLWVGVKALEAFIAILTGLANMGADNIQKLIEAFTIFASGMLVALDTISLLFVMWLSKLTVTIIQQIPVIMGALTEAIIQSLVNIIDSITAFLPNALTAILNNIMQNVDILLAFLPMIATKVLMLIKMILTSVETYLPAILKSVQTILLAITNSVLDTITLMLAALIQKAPMILLEIETLLVLISATILNFIYKLLTLISENLPKILEKVQTIFLTIVTFILDTITKIVGALAEYIPILLGYVTQLALGILDVALQFIIDLITLIGDKAPDIIVAVVNLVGGILTGLIEAIPQFVAQLVEAYTVALIDFINRMADAIEEHTPELVDAVDRLINALVDAALLVLDKSNATFLEHGKKILTHVKDGISNNLSEISDVAKNVVKGFIDGIKKKFTDLANIGKEFGGTVLDALKGVFDVNSPSKETFEIGKFVVFGLANAIKDYSSDATKEATNMGQSTLSAMSEALKGASDILENENAPTIRPILDLSDVRNEASTIGSMFNNPSITGLAGDIERTRMDNYNMQMQQADGYRMLGQQVVNALNGINSKDRQKIDIEIGLEPKSKAMFNMVRAENKKFNKATGLTI